MRDAIRRRPDLATTFAGDEPPLRAELFSREQMAQHGQVLAASHRLSTSRGSDALLIRLAQNEALLAAVRALLTEAVNDDRRITPAGEWLLDNFYLIEEQIRTARRHLPAGYSRELPRLAARPVGRAAARLRHRARDDLARGRPSGHGRPRRIRLGLPDGDAAHDRRAVGHPDHAAAGPASRTSAAWQPGSGPTAWIGTAPTTGRTR